MHILIAEDDAALCDGLARFLRQCGHSVQCAADGEAASRALDAPAHAIDLLVLDLGLPKVSGAQVLQRLRIRSPQLPVLLISALDDALGHIGGLGLAVEDYLPKPFSLDAFDASIRRLSRLRALPAPRLVGYGPLTSDPATGTVRLDGDDLELRPMNRRCWRCWSNAPEVWPTTRRSRTACPR